MNVKRIEKKLLIFLKISTLEYERQTMAFILFDIQANFLIGTFLIKLTQTEKTGSTSTFFIPLRNLKIGFYTFGVR